MNDTTLVLISKPRQIIAEFRFFIVQNQVVTGSYYSWDSRDTLRQKEPLVSPDLLMPRARELAEKVAKFDWQLDTCYSCDIAVTPEDRCKIVELNSFACAGFYDSDLEAIVRAVSAAAAAEWSLDG